MLSNIDVNVFLPTQDSHPDVLTEPITPIVLTHFGQKAWFTD